MNVTVNQLTVRTVWYKNGGCKIKIKLILAAVIIFFGMIWIFSHSAIPKEGIFQHVSQFPGQLQYQLCQKSFITNEWKFPNTSKQCLSSIYTSYEGWSKSFALWVSRKEIGRIFFYLFFNITTLNFNTLAPLVPEALNSQQPEISWLLFNSLLDGTLDETSLIIPTQVSTQCSLEMAQLKVVARGWLSSSNPHSCKAACATLALWTGALSWRRRTP